ncbi:PTS sugar transporter subunit IIA [Sporolactobacillus sp. THM19-2]|uniref:PTS sugar transporter subunit IIA n=1 Tax=Sporolactobacillus sp. THM19-2 TaxID=2511171 RepID=UPI00101F1E15|nr:PTS fructose transporter subunit IIA [Sporolactobacillus sp. THM19-2]RYL91644.1 PTS fructose transporter subunit IIA [Sporolactobacillus sp. THM19-2]
MKRILIATHGRLADGMLNSIELLAGTTKGIATINAYTNDTNLDAELEKFIDSLAADDQLFVFTDLYGGSVNQKVTKTFLEHKIPVTIITGFNFPIILEILLSGDDLTQEKVAELVDKCRLELKVSFLAEAHVKDDGEDFF